MIKWLRDELHIIDTARRCDELAESVPDANGCYIVPAFTGLGAPYWDMYARGCIVGLTRGVNSAHIARAVLESITYQVTDLLEAMYLDSQIELAEVRVDGGASVSDIMMQIQSDMLGVELSRPVTVETTALGAAYLLRAGRRFWNDLGELKQQEGRRGVQTADEKGQADKRTRMEARGETLHGMGNPLRNKDIKSKHIEKENATWHKKYRRLEPLPPLSPTRLLGSASQEDAEICADVLPRSDKRASSRTASTVSAHLHDRILAGIQQPVTRFEVIRETPTTAKRARRHGPGRRQVDEYGHRKSEKYGMGMVAVRNSCHCGIAGHPSMAIKKA